jgi:hypothetical protein
MPSGNFINWQNPLQACVSGNAQFLLQRFPWEYLNLEH